MEKPNRKFSPTAIFWIGCTIWSGQKQQQQQQNTLWKRLDTEQFWNTRKLQSQWKQKERRGWRIWTRCVDANLLWCIFSRTLVAPWSLYGCSVIALRHNHPLPKAALWRSIYLWKVPSSIHEWWRTFIPAPTSQRRSGWHHALLKSFRFSSKHLDVV